MRQFIDKKKVLYHELADREFAKFPIKVIKKFKTYIAILEKDGYLEYPDSKNLGGGLFEIRVNILGAWRVIYAYVEEEEIIILHAFNKKTQKTPKLNLETARKRLNNLII